MSTTDDQLKNFKETLLQLIYLLPDSYNKETSDTNYYRLLRALAAELSDARIEIEQLTDDIYLQTVDKSRIYDNFGVLVKLNQNPDWDSEKYRRSVQGVIQSLLKGPTKQSMIDGLKLFTQFDVKIYELYKDLDKLDPSITEGYNPKYTFLIEIEKPIDAEADQKALIRDANYIVNIIKPAHTIGIIITTLVGDESYRLWYRERFNIDGLQSQLTSEQQRIGLPDYYNMDSDTTDVNLEPAENIYGYKYTGPGIFTTMQSKIGGTDLIGPRYTLFDLETVDFADDEQENFETPISNVSELDTSSNEDYIAFDRTLDTHAEDLYYVDVAELPDDSNKFELEALSDHEDYYGLVGDSKGIFQLSSTTLGSQLDGSQIISPSNRDMLTDFGIDESEFVDLTAKQDDYALDATQPLFSDSVDTQNLITNLEIKTYNSDQLNLVQMQSIAPLTTNLTPLNSSRLMGIDRDQVVMEMYKVDTTTQSNQAMFVHWYSV